MSEKPPAYAPGYQSNPTQTEYPPQQSDYPPQQPDYPPQQSDYPPQQPDYPPQQPDYSPQQPDYPPQQPGYPPQQPGYPPQQPGYPPQQPGYPPPQGQQGQQSSTAGLVAPSVAVVGRHHKVPMNVTCLNCRQPVTTRISYEAGCLAWTTCAILILLGCWLGCCLIPFYVKGCQDARHTCPNCNTSIGVCKPI